MLEKKRFYQFHPRFGSAEIFLYTFYSVALVVAAAVRLLHPADVDLGDFRVVDNRFWVILADNAIASLKWIEKIPDFNSMFKDHGLRFLILRKNEIKN